MSEYKQIDFNKCNAGELMNLYLEFEKTLLKKWKAPLVNDFFAMIYYGVLQKLVVKYQIEGENIHNDLLCGARDIISTEPVRRSLELATMIGEDGSAKRIFLENESEEIWMQLNENSYVKIKRSFDEYIEKFGERCVGELKLETISYKQNPLAFVKIIKSYVEQGITKGSVSGTLDEELRVSAERKVARSLKGRLVKKMIFNYFLRGSRMLVSSRENLRYERTRAFGIVREIFSAIGKNFYSEGIIDGPRDIFYLSKEEIFVFIQGTSSDQRPKELITLRKKEFASYETMMVSERIHTYGMVYHGNNFHQPLKNKELNGDLKGIGCCPGRVRAKVRVVKDPNEVGNLNGDILVTSSTDPGWVTLFPTASAILVERGSLLSHSAIVSREMGKPCIVGVTGLLDILNSGDEVEMDGSTGEIKIINRCPVQH